MRKILNIAVVMLAAWLLTGCQEDDTIIGGAWPVAALVDVTDADGNSLLDIVNNPDNILADEDNLSAIKAVEGDATYTLSLTDEVNNYLNDKRQPQGRSRCAIAEFLGLYLTDTSTMPLMGGDQAYLGFGQFPGDEEVKRSFTLYLPGRTEGIEIEYRRERDSKTGGFRTVTVIDGVEHTDGVPRIVL